MASNALATCSRRTVCRIVTIFEAVETKVISFGSSITLTRIHVEEIRAWYNCVASPAHGALRGTSSQKCSKFLLVRILLPIRHVSPFRFRNWAGSGTSCFKGAASCLYKCLELAKWRKLDASKGKLPKSLCLRVHIILTKTYTSKTSQRCVGCSSALSARTLSEKTSSCFLNSEADSLLSVGNMNIWSKWEFTINRLFW